MGALNGSDSSTWLSKNSCSLEAFRQFVERTPIRSQYPRCAAIEDRVPIYDANDVRAWLASGDGLRELMTEWNAILGDGPGVLVFKRAYPDTAIVDQVTEILRSVIDSEAAEENSRGDHFGKPGANARVWNAHEKLCAANPEAFIRYNANHIIPLISRAWLGPLYQITTQVNLVYPGGTAQTPHRDYHMGFQSIEQLEHYPANAHRLSAALTLQGAIAHCDMPIESGPTKLLPYSQLYLPGYLAILLEEFRSYFESNFVQLPLQKGDELWFNPALYHAAGTNRSRDIARFANLLQVGSGYGRSIELVNRARISKAVFPALSRWAASGRLDEREVENVIAASGEGYPFPANLDIDSPLSGMAPPSQQDIMRTALAERWDQPRFDAAIDNHEAARDRPPSVESRPLINVA
jgi:ectoine hydroxylase-related dioxygenase (phytanoyl-CoA dioxygenase family)